MKPFRRVAPYIYRLEIGGRAAEVALHATWRQGHGRSTLLNLDNSERTPFVWYAVGFLTFVFYANDL